MARGKTHIVVGCAVGLAISCMDRAMKSEVSHHPATAISVAGFFSKLPDFIEPATNPQHRQFCHSIGILCALGYSFKKTYEWRPTNPMEKCFRGLILMAAGGYISHLVLDAATPSSLPLVGKF